MIDKVKAHLEEVKQFNATTPEAVEEFRIKYAGKKGILNGLFSFFSRSKKRGEESLWASAQRIKNSSCRKS